MGTVIYTNVPSNHQKMVLGPRDHRCGVVERSHGLAVTEADDDPGPLFRHQFLDDFSMFLVSSAPGDLRRFGDTHPGVIRQLREGLDPSLAIVSCKELELIHYLQIYTYIIRF